MIAPIGLTAGSANAATSCVTKAVNTDTATFHATQPSGGGRDWNHTCTVKVAADGGFSGKNVITGLDAGLRSSWVRVVEDSGWASASGRQFDWGLGPGSTPVFAITRSRVSAVRGLEVHAGAQVLALLRALGEVGILAPVTRRPTTAPW